MKFWRLAVMRPAGSDTTFSIMKNICKWYQVTHTQYNYRSTFSEKGALMLSRSDSMFLQTKVFFSCRSFVFGRIVYNFRKLVDIETRFLCLEHNFWGVENPRGRVATGWGQVATGREWSLDLWRSPQDKSHNEWYAICSSEQRTLEILPCFAFGPGGKGHIEEPWWRNFRAQGLFEIHQTGGEFSNSGDLFALGNVTDLKRQFYRFVQFSRFS